MAKPPRVWKADNGNDITVRFTFAGSPVPKPRMTRSDVWRKPPRPSVARWYEFKDLFSIAAREAGIYPGDEIHELYVRIHLKPRGRGRARGGWHIEKPDLSNVLKAIEDALTDNDEMIYREGLEKLYADENGPRIELTVVLKRAEGFDLR